MPLVGPQVDEVVLAEYEDDLWLHERYVLSVVSLTEFIVVTPHWDLYVEPLSDYAALFRPGPQGGLPSKWTRRGEHLGKVIRFDRAELDRRLPHLRRLAAAELAKIRGANAGSAVALDAGAGGAESLDLGGGRVSDRVERGVEPGVVYISMESRYDLVQGDPLPASWVIVHEGDRALATSAVGTVCAARLGTWEVSRTSDPISGVADDLRTLPMLYDAAGGRARSYRSAVEAFSESSFEDWHLAGPRTCRWLLRAIQAQDYTPSTRHFWWRNCLGLSLSDEGVEEHGMLSEILEQAACYDALNVSELLSYEVVARKYQMWEEYYRSALRNANARAGTSSSLDAEEKDIFLGQRGSRGLALVCPALEEYVAVQLRDRSAILKERRKAREERTLFKPDVQEPHGGPNKGSKGGNRNKGDKG